MRSVLRKGDNLRWLLLVFLIIPLLEILVFVWLGGSFGAWSVILLILLTGIAGVMLTKQQGMETWQKAYESMQVGRYPTEQIIDGICILVGGLLLITPGFITDIFGFILVLPWTRPLLKRGIQKIIRYMLNKGTVIYWRF